MIVKLLKELQKELNLKDGAFAKTIQTDRGTWNKIKNRRRQLSPRLILIIYQVYPQLRDRILPLIAEVSGVPNPAEASQKRFLGGFYHWLKGFWSYHS